MEEKYRQFLHEFLNWLEYNYEISLYEAKEIDDVYYIEKDTIDELYKEFCNTQRSFTGD